MGAGKGEGGGRGGEGWDVGTGQGGVEWRDCFTTCLVAQKYTKMVTCMSWIKMQTCLTAHRIQFLFICPTLMGCNKMRIPQLSTEGGVGTIHGSCMHGGVIIYQIFQHVKLNWLVCHVVF